MAAYARPDVVGHADWRSDGTQRFLTTYEEARSGIGAWTRTGDAEYTTTVVRLTADQQHHGTFAGMLRIRTRLTLDASGDAWDGQSTVEVLAPDGGIVRSRESTQKATRITAGSAEAAVHLAASAEVPSTLPA